MAVTHDLTSTIARRRERFRRLRGGVALVAAALAAGSLAGCGGGSTPDSAPPATVSATVSSTPSPSESATPTSTPEPLSPFENEAPVKVLRKWAAAYARDVNAHRSDLKSAQQYESPSGITVLPATATNDLGLHYPGPLPFTPVDVKVAGHKAEVAVCVWGHGFAVDPKTNRPGQKKEIFPSTFEMSHHGRRWLVDNAVNGSADCGGVKVKGVTW